MKIPKTKGKKFLKLCNVDFYKIWKDRKWGMKVMKKNKSKKKWAQVRNEENSWGKMS